MIEVHPTPDFALKDGVQSLTFENFERLMSQVGALANSVGRRLATGAAKM
jgi:3-deoxy-7-phosphoheptulonate synthase